MPQSGKYDFPGIKKAGAAALKLAMASVPWLAPFVRGPFGILLDPIINYFINWAANRGLIVLNLGAIIVSGQADQAAFDKALEEGLAKVELSRDKLSPEQGKAIDDAVISAARKFISFS